MATNTELLEALNAALNMLAKVIETGQLIAAEVELERLRKIAPKPAPVIPPPSPLGRHKVDDNGVAAVKRFEGFTAKAYWDYAQWSIGYGTRANGGDDTITREAAEVALRRELRICEQWLDDNITVPLTQGQVNGLCSFGYNLGTDDLDRLKGDLNNRRFTNVAQRMLSFNRAGGKVLPGLVARRQGESTMFLT